MACTIVVQSSSPTSLSKTKLFSKTFFINIIPFIVPLVVAESIRDTLPIDCSLGNATTLKTDELVILLVHISY